MSIQEDDERLERQLKRFRPLEVAPLPERAKPARRWFTAAIATAALVMLGIVGLLWHSHSISKGSVVSNVATSANQITLGESHAALMRAASFDAAINQLEREGRLKDAKTAKGKHSAFEVLGRDYEKVNF